nr:MAG TPA: hypothetical protein [Caudoviricetes sp.]
MVLKAIRKREKAQKGCQKFFIKTASPLIVSFMLSQTSYGNHENHKGVFFIFARAFGQLLVVA